MSYVTDYLQTCEKTKPPLVFHIWSMLATLSVFAGRRFWFPFGSLRFYPNLYVTLVGDPGGGKSTAMNRAKAIVRSANVCPVAASQITKEALMQKMSSTHEGKPKPVPFAGQRFFTYEDQRHEYNQYAIFATELTQFIGVNPMGFLEFLTAVWDEPVVEVETKNKGCDYVLGPYVTMLACMTPDIVKGYLKMNILSSGFARRNAFVFSSDKNIVHWPEFTEEQQAAEKRCVEFGRRIQSCCGAFGVSQECRSFYEDWDTENENTIKDRSPAIRGWFESKGEMLWKIAMLVALAEESPLVIEVPHYKLALQFCAMLEKNLTRVFEGTGINPNAQAASQICRMLEALDKPMNLKQVLALFFDNVTSLNELKDTITHLCSVGRLAQKDVNANGQILGTVIGTPMALQRATTAELVAVVARVATPPPAKDTDQNP